MEVTHIGLHSRIHAHSLLQIEKKEKLARDWAAMKREEKRGPSRLATACCNNPFYCHLIAALQWQQHARTHDRGGGGGGGRVVFIIIIVIIMFPVRENSSFLHSPPNFFVLLWRSQS